MKRRVKFASILAASLIISITFIHPITACTKDSIDLTHKIENNTQDFESILKKISRDNDIQRKIEPLLQDKQIKCMLEQIKIADNPNERYNLLTELKTILAYRDLNPELLNILIEKYGTEITIIEEFFPNDIDWDNIEAPKWVFIKIILLIWLILLLLWEKWFSPPFPP